MTASALEHLKALEGLIESFGYTSYLYDAEKEADPIVISARKALEYFQALAKETLQEEPEDVDGPDHDPWLSGDDMMGASG